jgi:hypothetical protein
VVVEFGCGGPLLLVEWRLKRVLDSICYSIFDRPVIN